ncbi:hypothetical protein OEZ86_009955 [Tetradesmus obliquus]|uniref:Uncharacterized protein n=2 Tax=Tetradesmus obliquus TaxID=3088 RepID=A0A383VLA8_TETOB|nr:hypothetical protein OEZ85_001389 [Tetradesmus obliquus]WIA43492.1 hypothetical protein OEZ86_009955 [Tetradesmus obliquus]|eukprot:jgi/Sobl393_1/17247/SZX65176.1
MALTARCSALRTGATVRPARLACSAVPRPVLPQRRGVVARAQDTEQTVEVDQMVKDLQEKWDKVENKTTVVAYGVGGIVLIWFSSTLVTALNGIPLLPKFMELVGLGYTSWFIYRYLLFKSSREELVKDVDELKKKITGEGDASASFAEAKSAAQKAVSNTVGSVRRAVDDD